MEGENRELILWESHKPQHTLKHTHTHHCHAFIYQGTYGSSSIGLKIAMMRFLRSRK